MKKGDKVKVVRVIPGGFTEKTLGKVGVLLHADTSLVPYLVDFTPDEKDFKKKDMHWFFEGRLEVCNEQQ